MRAFEVHALDYLLKPFDRERFDKALRRAKHQIERERVGAVNRELAALLADLKSRPKPLDRLVIKAGGRVFFLRVDEIDWIEAAANYVKLRAGKETHLLRETINGLAAKLDPDKFLRIHRSIIVNLERVKEMQPWFHGDYVIIMQDGAQLTSSRNYREQLRKLLGGKDAMVHRRLSAADSRHNLSVDASQVDKRRIQSVRAYSFRFIHRCVRRDASISAAPLCGLAYALASIRIVRNGSRNARYVSDIRNT
jgi:hypothetical protein